MLLLEIALLCLRRRALRARAHPHSRCYLEFGNEPSAVASFEISGGIAGTPVTALLEVARTLDGPPLIAVPLAITSTGEQRFLAMGTVVIGALPAGDYVVRGIITLGDGTTGRVETTLRKR